MLTLDKIPTRKLLDTYKSCRYHMNDDMKIRFQSVVRGGEIEDAYFTPEQIKEELDTREHIPSKTEGKKIRRLMAQNKMSEKEVRKRFKIN